MARERLDKIIASTGRWSRREAKALIREGRVLVEEVIAASAEEKVDPERAAITVDGEDLGYRRFTYILLNKPGGLLSATEDSRQGTVLDLLAPELRRIGLFPVGRLDKDSEGLLLMTNDGNFANTLMHPGNHIGKTYRVTVRPEVTEDQLVRLAAGVTLDDGYTTQRAQVHVLAQQPGRAVLQMTITEGKNRQIRRMCEAVGLEVARLKRTYIGPLKLGMLQPGEYRELTAGELSAIRAYMQKADNRRKGEEAAGKAAEKPGRPAGETAPKAEGRKPLSRKPLGRR